MKRETTSRLAKLQQCMGILLFSLGQLIIITFCSHTKNYEVRIEVSRGQGLQEIWSRLADVL